MRASEIEVGTNHRIAIVVHCDLVLRDLITQINYFSPRVQKKIF